MNIQENILFRDVAEQLKKDFMLPNWKIGDKIESESSLIARFQVSRKTVRNALERLASEGLIEKSQGKRGILLRKPLNEKHIRHGLNFGIVGNENIMNANINDIPAIAQGIISGLNSMDATLSLFPFLSNQSPGALDSVKSLIKKHVVDGFFIFPSKDCNEVCEYLRQKKIPYVYIVPFFQTNKVYPEPFIRSGEHDILQNAVQELAERKIKKLVFLAGENDSERPGTIFKQIFSNKELSSKIEYITHDCRNFQYSQLIDEIRKNSSPETAIMCSNEFAHLFDIARETLPLIRGENIGEMLLFKHFSPDWKNYQKHFKIIERDYFEIGIRAVEQLKKELEKIQKYLEK